MAEWRIKAKEGKGSIVWGKKEEEAIYTYIRLKTKSMTKSANGYKKATVMHMEYHHLTQKSKKLNSREQLSDCDPSRRCLDSSISGRESRFQKLVRKLISVSPFRSDYDNSPSLWSSPVGPRVLLCGICLQRQTLLRHSLWGGGSWCPWPSLLPLKDSGRGEFGQWILLTVLSLGSGSFSFCFSN